MAGLGPKGLYALERLLDCASRLRPPARIRVDVFEPHPAPGAGPVYDPDQPAYLRMNFAAANLDMWWPAGGVVPRARRCSFVEWRAAHGGGDDDYPPRAEVGRYLGDGFASLLRHAPPNVEVRLRRERVDSLRRVDDGRWDVRAGGTAARYDEVLVAVGHQGGSDVFPVERRLGRGRIAPGATVAIRGFALTFIDAALALTEGRGGAFETLAHPYRLRYIPAPTTSGRSSRSAAPGCRCSRSPARGWSPARAGWRRSRRAAGRRSRRSAHPWPSSRSAPSSPKRRTRACAPPAPGRDAQRRGLTPALRVPCPACARAVACGRGGLLQPDRDWALGHAWRALYPAIVSRLGGDGLAGRTGRRSCGWLRLWSAWRSGRLRSTPRSCSRWSRPGSST